VSINYNHFKLLYHIVVLMGGVYQWNEAMWLITDFLPKAQPEGNSCWLHISHNVHKWPGRQMLLHQTFLVSPPLNARNVPRPKQ